jgi:thiamine biosynthesis lipoprotein
MSKMFTDFVRHALNGPTMGTRWTALFYAKTGFNTELARLTLQSAVDEVDAQMSTWKPGSDLMRLNAAPPSRWIDVPAHLMAVLKAALAIGRASGGAFDVGMGDAVSAWGFGPAAASPERIRAAMASPRQPAHDVLELEADQVLKRAPIMLDLNGIAKGYGVDRLAETLAGLGITSGLFGIDGEMRALGLRPDGEAWTIAIEKPAPERRAPHSIIALQDAAVATSGDYRHWVDVGGRRLSHTMDPARGLPLAASPVSVTVIARTCTEADAWATALMVKGSQEGLMLARNNSLHALFMDREAGHLREAMVGGLFEARSHPGARV